MKSASRASERNFYSKKQNYCRKMSPSVIFKPSEFFHIKPKPILNSPNHTSAVHIVQNSINQIMKSTELAIEQIEKHQFCLQLQTQIETILYSIESQYLPQVQQQQIIHFEEEQPNTSIPDSICGNERLMQKQNKRKQASATAPTSPTKQNPHQYRIKLVQSTKQHYRFNKLSQKTISKRHSQGIVPLTFVESEKDLRLTQLEIMYRDKYLLQEDNTSKLTDELPQIMITANRFNQLNTRSNDQFAFDYNGNKIPIASTSIKRNSIHLLKTICRLHKDRTETKNVTKIQEGSWNIPAQNWSKSYRKFMDNSDIKTLKKGIEESVNWQGKLASLKMISEIDQNKVQSR